MKLFQISDLHIAAADEFPSEVDVRQNFEKIIGQIPKYNADAIVLTGDLCYREGNSKIYKWIRSCLSGLDLPVYAISGNHDNSGKLAEVFHPEKRVTTENKLYYFVKKGEEILFFLDSGDGQIGAKQFSWLKEKTDKYQPQRLIVFMHHPPVLAEVPHMDGKHSLKDLEAFQQFTAEYGKEVHVFCGHYHVSKQVVRDNMNIYICPASFFQIDQSAREFKVEHTLPGYRLITIKSDSLLTDPHYVIN